MIDDDADERDDCKRKTRNLSEKKRRDQFNLLVNELNTMISTSNRKMDKSTVLKSTISFLKSHNETTVRSRANEIQEDWKPSFLSNEEFTHLILEALDGFIMVFTSSGKINYASEGITSLLGHLPNDLLNTSIYEITFDDDRPSLFNILQNTRPVSSERTDENKGRQVVFACHLKRGCLDCHEGPTYELVQFTGYFRIQSNEIQDSNNRYSNSSESYARSIFVCTGRLQIPQLIRDMSVVDSSKSEFTSRHSLEWKFLFLDHRAPPIIGYLPFEVLGTSGYDYYHFDDLDKVVTCHEALMQKGEGTSCYYRFLTKGQQWIWLQTRFYITYHQWNSKPEFVVCTHRVVSYQDVFKSIHKDNDYNVQPNTPAEPSNRFYESQNSTRYSSHSDGGPYQSNSWRKRSSKISKCSAASDVSSSHKRSYSKRFHGSTHSSDTASISTESINSRRSPLSYRHTRSVILHDSDRSGQLNQYTRLNLPTPVYQPLQQFQPVSDHPHIIQNLQHSQSFHEHQGLEPREQIISHYVDPPPYLTLPIPATINFPSIQQLPTSSDIGIMITPNQAQLQEQLQKKHEELKKMIKLQQDELQRVSEQLVMAKYGLLPPIINVAFPHTGLVPAGGNITWNEPFEMYSARPLPLPAPQPVEVEHQNQQPNAETNNFNTMQMSQHQAQSLFSSTDNNQSTERPG